MWFFFFTYFFFYFRVCVCVCSVFACLLRVCWVFACLPCCDACVLNCWRFIFSLVCVMGFCIFYFLLFWCNNLLQVFRFCVENLLYGSRACCAFFFFTAYWFIIFLHICSACALNICRVAFSPRVFLLNDYLLRLAFVLGFCFFAALVHNTFTRFALLVWWVFVLSRVSSLI